MMVEVIISFMFTIFLTCFIVFGLNAITANNKRDCLVSLGWALGNAVMFVFVVLQIPTWLGV